MTPRHFHTTPHPEEALLMIISAAIGTLNSKLKYTHQRITDEFNEYCNEQKLDFKTDRTTVSRMQSYDRDDSKLLGREKRPHLANFLKLTLASHDYHWHTKKNAFLNEQPFESKLFDRIKGRYNAIGIDQDGLSLFVSQVHIFEEDEILESKCAHVNFIFGDEEHEVTIPLELWERHFFFTINHELFPMSAFFRANLATKPKIIFGVHWAADENTLQPFGSPFVLQRIYDTSDELPLGRLLSFDEFPDRDIAQFLKNLGGTFNIPVQQYYDERDLK